MSHLFPILGKLKAEEVDGEAGEADGEAGEGVAPALEMVESRETNAPRADHHNSHHGGDGDHTKNSSNENGSEKALFGSRIH